MNLISGLRAPIRRGRLLSQRPESGGRLRELARSSRKCVGSVRHSRQAHGAFCIEFISLALEHGFEICTVSSLFLHLTLTCPEFGGCSANPTP